MAGRYKMQIIIKIDNMHIMANSMLTGTTNVNFVLDEMSNEIIAIGELLVNYDDLGADLIVELEDLVTGLDKIGQSIEAGRPIRMPVDMLLAKLVKVRKIFDDKIPPDKLEYFKTKTDKVMLLWRPHPLIQATLDSMRPELSARYSGIVERYKQENWGIYDDTPDLNRSIALCNAYYGDDSSVIQLFQGAEKPVMVEDVEIMN